MYRLSAPIFLILAFCSQSVFCDCRWDGFEYECEYESDVDLSTGAIVGIVIAFIVVTIVIPVILCFCCAWCCFKSRAKRHNTQVLAAPVVAYGQPQPVGAQVIFNNSNSTASASTIYNPAYTGQPTGYPVYAPGSAPYPQQPVPQMVAMAPSPYHQNMAQNNIGFVKPNPPYPNANQSYDTMRES